MLKSDDGMRRVILRGQEVGRFQSTGDLRKDAEIAREIMIANGFIPHTDAQAMHLQGYAFATAAQVVHDELLQKDGRGEGAAPFVVNAAFALEVYLKSIFAALDQTVPIHHDLSKLLANLPDEGRVAIQLQIPHFWTGEVAAERFDLAAIVDSLAGAFVHWRYYYEGTGKAQPVNVASVIYALNVIHRASRAIVYGLI